jgi:hypothetical protein
MQNPFHLLKRKSNEEQTIKESMPINPLGKMLSLLKRPSLINFDGVAKSIGFNLDGTTKEASYNVKCNSLGFRSDEFKSNHDDGMHILFAGCSETFGEGGPLEDAWAYKTYTAINSIEKTTGYFNIGFPGKGYQDIINLSLEYINLYGSPDHLILAFPSILRKVAWVEVDDLDIPEVFDKKTFIDGYYMVMPRRHKGSKGKINGVYFLAGSGLKLKNEFVNSDINTEYANFYLAMKTLEALCKEKKINLLWTCIDMFSKEINKAVNDDFRESFIPVLVLEGETLEYMALHPGTTYEKEDGHRGTADHSIWSEKMVARIFHSINKGDVNAKE